MSTAPGTPGTPGTPGAASLKQQVSRAITWNTLFAPLKTIIELSANLIILNVLSVPQVGILRVVTAAAGTLGVWVDMGIDRALPRFIPELEQEQGRAAVRRFMRVIFLIKLALLLVFSSVALLFAGRFIAHLLAGVEQLPPRIDAAARAAVEHDILTLAPWLIATVLVLVALGSFYDGLMAYLVSYFRQRAWNLITLSGDVIQPTTAAVLVLSGFGVAGVLVALVLTPTISVLLAGWQVLTGLVGQHTHTPTAASSAAKGTGQQTRLWSRFALYTAMSHVLNLSDYVMSWLFAIFLLDNLAQVGLYTVGTAMVRQALALLYRPLVGVQVPLFTRVKAGDADLPATYAAVGRLLALVLLPGGVGLVLVARELILVQYPDFAGAELVIYLLTPFLFLETFMSSAQIVLQVYERYRLLLLSRAATLLVLPLMLWLAPAYGMVGAALAVGGGRVLIGVTAVLLAQPTFHLRYSWRFFGRVALATLAMAGIVLGLKHLLRLDEVGSAVAARLLAAVPLLGVMLVGALCFVVALRLLGGLEPQDRRWILEQRVPFKRWLVRLL